MSKAKKAVKKNPKAVASVAGKTVVPKGLQSLQLNEQIISKAQSSFLDIGKALKAIRDQKQFKAVEFDSFEAYCLTKWSYSKSYASRLIGAHSCYELLRKSLSLGEDHPCNEYQLRSLAALPEAKWVATWRQIVREAGGKPVTGEMVEAAVKGIQNPQGKDAQTGAKAGAPASAAKLAEIGKLVQGALKIKTKTTKGKLIQVLLEIKKLVATKAKKATKARKSQKGPKGPKAEKAG